MAVNEALYLRLKDAGLSHKAALIFADSENSTLAGGSIGGGGSGGGLSEQDVLTLIAQHAPSGGGGGGGLSLRSEVLAFNGLVEHTDAQTTFAAQNVGTNPYLVQDVVSLVDVGGPASLGVLRALTDVVLSMTLNVTLNANNLSVSPAAVMGRLSLLVVSTTDFTDPSLVFKTPVGQMRSVKTLNRGGALALFPTTTFSVPEGYSILPQMQWLNEATDSSLSDADLAGATALWSVEGLVIASGEV